jgi:hypothetical protein
MVIPVGEKKNRSFGKTGEIIFKNNTPNPLKRGNNTAVQQFSLLLKEGQGR